MKTKRIILIGSLLGMIVSSGCTTTEQTHHPKLAARAPHIENILIMDPISLISVDGIAAGQKTEVHRSEDAHYALTQALSTSLGQVGYKTFVFRPADCTNAAQVAYHEALRTRYQELVERMYIQRRTGRPDASLQTDGLGSCDDQGKHLHHADALLFSRVTGMYESPTSTGSTALLSTAANILLAFAECPTWIEPEYTWAQLQICLVDANSGELLWECYRPVGGLAPAHPDAISRAVQEELAPFAAFKQPRSTEAMPMITSK